MLLDKHERGDTVPFAGDVSALQFTTAICNLRKKIISFIGHFEVEIETGRCCVELHYGIAY